MYPLKEYRNVVELLSKFDVWKAAQCVCLALAFGLNVGRG